jgi:hypothetical protein
MLLFARTSMKPEKLSLYIGGYMGTSYSVELNDGTLVYKCWADRSEGEETHTIKPSAEAWATFWDRLDGLGFWSWSGEYRPRGIILDGTDWSVEISVAKHAVEAHGCNAYPPSSPRARRPREAGESGSRFDEFCDAVSELVGGRRFG